MRNGATCQFTLRLQGGFGCGIQPTMGQYQAAVDGVEVSGEAVLAVVIGLGIHKEKALQILENHGISNPRAGKWYAQQNWLDAFKEIADRVGPNALFAIGKAMPASGKRPTGAESVNSLEAALKIMDIAYHMNHRLNGKVMYDAASGTMLEGIGHYRVEKRNGRMYVVCDNPYPCDFDRGIITSLVQQFKPEGTLFIQIERHGPTSECRKQGADSCVYEVVYE